MILTLFFSIVIFASLWPYFVALDVMNFKKSDTMMEDHLPGRPARRTIGRKNGDVIKGILAILGCYIILCGTFYGLPSFRNVLSDNFMLMIVIGLSAYAFYMVTPHNRALHAYVTTGQIAVIHICCSLSSYTVWSAILHDNHVTIGTAIFLSTMVLGTMLIFSRKQVRES